MLLSIVACGSDKDSANTGVTCGEGTVLAAGKCIPQCGPGTVLQAGQCVVGGNGAGGGGNHAGSTDDAGSAGSDDDDAGSAGESEAQGGSAGTSHASGGRASGGQPAGGSAGAEPVGGSSGSYPTGGSAGSNPTGGSAGSNSTGGSAGSNPAGGGAGSGATGAGGAGPLSPPHWLAFSNSSGVFAYDVTKFPSTSGLVSLETGTARSNSTPWSPWSPDGHWLVYWVRNEVYCRDMTTAVPGPALLLATTVQYSSNVAPTLSWSADSKTVSITTYPNAPTGSNPPSLLQVLDPTRSAPPIRALAAPNGLISVNWAPVGDRVIYGEGVAFAAQGNVGHVRHVASGVPGADLVVAGYSFVWSPDGNFVAAEGGVNNRDLTLTDVSQAAPSPVTLSAPTVAEPYISNVQFSPDGKSLLFTGVQIRDGYNDLFRVQLKPTIGAPVRVSTGLTGNIDSGTFSFSPDGKWVTYSVYDPASSPATTRWAADLSGPYPGTPFQLVAPPSVFLPTAPQKYLASYNSGLSLFDLSNPSAAPVTVASNASGASFAPQSSIASYPGVNSQLFIRDLAHLEIPADGTSLTSTTGLRLWSPDGKFIAVVDNGQMRLVRLEGTVPSAPVSLQAVSSPLFAWQP
ncbi:MAG TPA: hypothetical protein VGC79_04320 [Polyangiaceae bacterium]